MDDELYHNSYLYYTVVQHVWQYGIFHMFIDHPIYPRIEKPLLAYNVACQG